MLALVLTCGPHIQAWGTRCDLNLQGQIHNANANHITSTNIGPSLNFKFKGQGQNIHRIRLNHGISHLTNWWLYIVLTCASNIINQEEKSDQDKR